MTRFGSALVIGILSGLLTACGPSQDRAAQQKQEPRPKIGLLMDTLDGRWPRDRDLILERAKELRADVLVESADLDDARQFQQAEALLAKGVQALVIVPHSAETAARVVEAAKKRKAAVSASKKKKGADKAPRAKEAGAAKNTSAKAEEASASEETEQPADESGATEEK